MVHTRVPLPEGDDAVVVKGVLPPSRMSSLSVHGALTDPPSSMELRPLPGHEDTREYEVEIRRGDGAVGESVSPSGAVSSVLHCAPHATHGMLVLRNYLVPSGTAVYSPEIRSKRDGRVLRAPQRLVAGPSALDVSDFRSAWRAKALATLHAVFWAYNAWTVCGRDRDRDRDRDRESGDASCCVWDTVSANAVVTAGALLCVCALRSALFEVGRRRFVAIRPDECNTLSLVDTDTAARDSQPSALHRYFMMRFDVSADRELRVTARIDSARQKYWSFVLYDEYGLPLPQFVCDENAVRSRSHSAASPTEYAVDIRVRDLRGAAPPCSAGATYVDLVGQRRGFALFRLVHPQDELVQSFSAPTAALVDLDVVEDKKNE